MYSKIQYISQGETCREQELHIRQALDAGCDWIQLRFKNKVELLGSGLAEKIKLACEKYKATLIVNDYVDLAKELDADGVHLGLSDWSVPEAQVLLGEGKIIGGTANTAEDVLKRISEKCSYIGLGPYRFTNTKKSLSPLLGLEGYRKILNGTDFSLSGIPVYAIGGIRSEDVAALIQCGAYGIAVSGLITESQDKKEVVERLKKSFYVTT